MCLPHMRGVTLDLGAGSAKYREMIKQRASKYVTFDIAPGPNIDVVGDVHHLPFDDRSFDTVVCTQVMEHVKEPWLMVEEIARILTPGGRCILTAPFNVPYHADPFDYYRYTLEGGSHLFTRAGFEIIESLKYGGGTAVLEEALKFTFCNPYKHPHPSFLRRNAFRLLQLLLAPFKKGAAQDAIIYANICIVAEKPTAGR